MSDLRGLIDAAKADGPSAAARAKMWAGVSTVVGAGSAASGAGSTGAGSMGAAKMLAVGTLLGGSVTVGIGVMVLLVGRTPLGPTTNAAPPAPAAEVMHLSMPVRSPVPAMTHAPIDQTPALRGAAHAAVVHPAVRTSVTRFDPARPAAVHASAAPPQVVTTDSTDTLAREASALAEARGALARRDALSALQIVRSLRALPGCQLVPEELAVEAQALRGLGLDDDANAVETRLRARFPDSVLGR